MARAKKPKKRNAGWSVERVDTCRGLYRLVGPLAKQKGRQKTMCVAIGSKRLKAVVDVLNEMGIEV